MRKMHDDKGCIFRYNEKVGKNSFLNGNYLTVALKMPKINRLQPAVDKFTSRIDRTQPIKILGLR